MSSTDPPDEYGGPSCDTRLQDAQRAAYEQERRERSALGHTMHGAAASAQARVEKVAGVAELNDEIAAEQASDRALRLGRPVTVADATALDTLERLDHNLSDFEGDEEP